MTPYITSVQADEYIAALIPSNDPEHVAWASLEASDKDIFISRAMLRIESLPFTGTAAVSFQETAFPRWGQTEVPEAVKQALALEAAAIAAYGAEAEKRERIQSQGVTSFSVGNLSESYVRRGRMALLSPVATYLLAPFRSGGAPCV